MKRKPRWTDADIAFLRANYGVLTAEQIALELGRGVTAIVAKITILRLARIHTWTPEQDEFLRKYSAKGWPWCAKELGRSVVSIYNRVRRIGIQSKMLDESELLKMRELYEKGNLTTVGVAERFGVTDECVRRWVRLWGLPVNKCDQKKRMATQRRGLIEKYGVPTVAKAKKVRRRRIREASLSLSLADIAKRISIRK